MAQLTHQQAFELALQHHQAGRLREAEQLYRQILTYQPEHVGALHNLGVIAYRAGRNDLAIEFIRKAIALKPNFPEAYSTLSNALKDSGQIDDAIAAARQAIAQRPNFPEAHSILGNALRDKGQLDESIAAYRQAIALRPSYAEAHCNLGNALRDIGQLDQALAACRQALALKPNFPEAYSNLGNVLRSKGQVDDAIAAYRQAIALQPNLAEAHCNLGISLTDKGQLPDAIAAYRQAIALKPQYAPAHNSLGNVLRNIGQLKSAIAECRQAVALSPNFAEAHCNLGNALSAIGQLDQAVAAYRQAIALKPSLPEAFNNLGSALKGQGQLDDAMAAYRQAVALNPDYAGAHSNLIYSLTFHPEYSAQQILGASRAWAQQYELPLAKQIHPHTHSRAHDPEQRLRIGYVSPDFRDHVVGRNLLPLFREHDHRLFEITCYAQVPSPDAMSQQFQQHADHWRNITGLTDEQVAEQIRADGIDVLVDLSLHMANNRLLVFARKPAPVQVTFAGYPGGTGLQAMDYRLTDPYLDPPGSDGDYVEKSLRLPDSFWCYDPKAMLLGIDAPPEVAPLPAAQAGHINFGCLSNFCKTNDATFALWIGVMSAVPDSRLLMLAPAGSPRQRVLNVFERGGIAPSRIAFTAMQERRQYLETFNQIDLCLDTLPYNAHTTSLDALWMGVPVVTLAGKTVVGRAGVSQLTNLGLTELIAQSPEQFIQIAARLCADLPRLAELRLTLRPRLLQSPLTDAARFARNVEAAYRQMWNA